MMFKYSGNTITKLSTHHRVATLAYQQKRVTFLPRMRLLSKQLFRQPIFRTVLYSLCCGLTLIVILLVGLIKYPTVVVAQTPTPVVVVQTPDDPIRCKINAYVMRLNDFNFLEDSFFIDVWLSANCNKHNVPGVDTLDFPTVKKYQLLNTTTVKVGEGIYISTNLEGIFTKDWNLENYPFDRHKLELFFETGGDHDVSKLVLEPDLKHSGIHPDINLEDGWKITKFTVESGITNYATNFGDPRVTTDKANYSKLIIAFEIQRTSYMSFVKLVTGVYIAFIICVLCVFFDVSQNDLFTASLSILVGCLFAVFVNLQVAESVLGTVDGLSLIDEIHIMTMLFIVIVCVVQTIFHMLYKGIEKKNMRRIESLVLGVLIALYVLINTILIVSARLAG